jgi:hypothetical protein
VQRMQRFARYWEIIANSGRFKATLALILETENTHTSPFDNFLNLSDALWSDTGKSSTFAPEKLGDWLFDHVCRARRTSAAAALAALKADFAASGARALPKCLTQRAQQRPLAQPNLEKLSTVSAH